MKNRGTADASLERCAQPKLADAVQIEIDFGMDQPGCPRRIERPTTPEHRDFVLPVEPAQKITSPRGAACRASCHRFGKGRRWTATATALAGVRTMPPRLL